MRRRARAGSRAASHGSAHTSVYRRSGLYSADGGVLGQVEKKVADLTVQLELSKSRGGGVLEDELSEKFEWLRSQQEQMLVVMTEAIREGKLGGGEAQPAEPAVPKQPPLHADAAATIQAVRVTVLRTPTRPPLTPCSKDAESCAGLCTGAPRPCGTDTAGRGERRGPDGPGAVALPPSAGVLPQPPQRRGGGPSQIPSNRFDSLSTRPVTRVWLGQAGATQIQAMWRARQQRLFFASRESVERGENLPLPSCCALGATTTLTT